MVNLLIDANLNIDKPAGIYLLKVNNRKIRSSVKYLQS